MYFMTYHTIKLQGYKHKTEIMKKRLFTNCANVFIWYIR